MKLVTLLVRSTLQRFKEQTKMNETSSTSCETDVTETKHTRQNETSYTAETNVTEAKDKGRARLVSLLLSRR